MCAYESRFFGDKNDSSFLAYLCMINESLCFKVIKLLNKHYLKHKILLSGSELYSLIKDDFYLDFLTEEELFYSLNKSIEIYKYHLESKFPLEVLKEDDFFNFINRNQEYDLKRIIPTLKFSHLRFACGNYKEVLSDFKETYKDLYLELNYNKKFINNLTCYNRFKNETKIYKIPEVRLKVYLNKENNRLKSCEVYRKGKDTLYYALEYEETSEELFCKKVLSLSVGVDNFLCGFVNPDYAFKIPGEVFKKPFNIQTLTSFYEKVSKKVLEIAKSLDVDVITFGENDYKNYEEEVLSLKKEYQILKLIDFNLFKEILKIKAFEAGIKVILIKYYFLTGNDYLNNEVFNAFSLYNIFVCEEKMKFQNLKLIPTCYLNEETIRV